MMLFADFGQAYSSHYAAITQINAAGAAVVARTNAGITALGHGAFVWSGTPNAACVAVTWDVATTTPLGTAVAWAAEGITDSVAIAAIPSASANASATLSAAQVTPITSDVFSVRGNPAPSGVSKLL